MRLAAQLRHIDACWRKPAVARADEQAGRVFAKPEDLLAAAVAVRNEVQGRHAVAADESLHVAIDRHVPTVVDHYAARHRGWLSPAFNVHRIRVPADVYPIAPSGAQNAPA